jgi:hypothetical protein
MYGADNTVPAHRSAISNRNPADEQGQRSAGAVAQLVANDPVGRHLPGRNRSKSDRTSSP